MFRDCTGVPETTTTDADCVKSKTECVTTGKGCIGSRGVCSNYTGNSTLVLEFQLVLFWICIPSTVSTASAKPTWCGAITDYDEKKLCKKLRLWWLWCFNSHNNLWISLWSWWIKNIINFLIMEHANFMKVQPKHHELFIH